MKENNSKSDREKIGTRLKDARILAGLSQDQAASQLKINRPAISEIESGKRKVSADELILFSNLYKVDTSWLLHEETDEMMSAQQKFAARELGKLDEEDIKKVLEVLKILPKK